MQQQERTRIFSHITRSRWLHIEDSLEIGKIRLFMGEYKRGEGAQATAYHFLDADDARPLMADLSWSKPADFVDFKGSANGGGQPISRVLKIKGPKDGKYWLQVDNGPGEVIGAGAVKPAGEPEASISIALTTWEARKMALAVIEYMAAFRVAALVGAGLAPAPLGTTETSPASSPRPQKVDPSTGEITSAAQDADDLFGSAEPAPAPVIARSEATKQSQPADDKPTTFYALAPLAITDHGLLDLVQELVKAPGSWSQKAARLQQAMAA